MAAPAQPDETEQARVVAYIHAMTLELAVLADRAGQPALGDHLRAATSKVERPVGRRH